MFFDGSLSSPSNVSRLFCFSYTWIGLNDIKNESNFEWSDGGNMTYQSMASQMDYMKDERADQEMDCIAADQNGQWTNFHCDDKFYCLCKTKLSKNALIKKIISISKQLR